MKNYVSHSLEETEQIAKEWLNNYKGGSVVGLSGHLGAGKTVFVKAVARGLGIEEEITSPTFVIMKIYETQHPKWKRLVHIDAYRLEKREELEVLNWEQLVSDPNNLIMVEWPENVGLDKDEGVSKLNFEVLNKSEYRIVVH